MSNNSCPKIHLSPDDRPNRIYAPFTDEQIALLNLNQSNGWHHPDTCGCDSHDSDPEYAKNCHSSQPNLIATTNGWSCPDPACDYQQNWAYAGSLAWHDNAKYRTFVLIEQRGGDNVMLNVPAWDAHLQAAFPCSGLPAAIIALIDSEPMPIIVIAKVNLGADDPSQLAPEQFEVVDQRFSEA